MKEYDMKAAVLGLGLAAGIVGGAGCSQETVDSAKRDAEQAAAKAEAAAEKAEAAADRAVEKGKEVATDLKADLAAALSKAKDSVGGIKDGPELVQELTTLIESGRKAIEEAKSSETAESAKARMAELETSMERLRERLKSSPEQLKQATSRLIENGRASLDKTVENIRQDPNVSEDVKQAIDRLLTKIDSLKGS